MLEQALAWSDATLMGAETLRIHKSTCLIHEQKLLEYRAIMGRSFQPISIIISNSKRYNLNWPYFYQPIKRWLLSSKQSSKTIQSSEAYDRYLKLESNWSQTLLGIYNTGITKLTVLGGAKLISSLLSEDEIDELQLTFTPKVIGGDCPWIPNSIKNLPYELSKPKAWKLKENKILNNDELLLRYYRERY